MSRRAARAVAAAALALVALLPSLALADHVYSHRFVFEGRLVGSDGLPLPAREVTFFAEGDDFVTPCADEPQQSITDEWGDFRFCFHKHDLRVTTVVGVRVGDVEARKPMDTAWRRTIVLLEDETQPGVAPDGWNETFRVAGKAWQYGAVMLDGVQVYGVAIPDLPVNVTLRTPEGASTWTVTTDAFGDFDATLRLLPNVTTQNATIHVEARGERPFVQPLDTFFHRNTVGLRLIPPEEVVALEANFPDLEAQRAAAPGADTPRVTGTFLVGIAGFAAVVLALRLRKPK